MTSASTRRAQSRQRGRRHRALRKRGKAAYCVRAHERRRAEALIKSGMPHHGSRHHQRRVRCWLRQARRPDRGSGDVDQCGSAVAPQASLRLSVFTCELFEPGRRACQQWGGECPKTRTNLDSAAAAIAHILSFGKHGRQRGRPDSAAPSASTITVWLEFRILPGPPRTLAQPEIS